MIDKLPQNIISYLGFFLELKEIYYLSLTCKNLHNKIKKEEIFHLYSSFKYNSNKLPDQYTSWSEYVREKSILKWETFQEGKIRILNHQKTGKSKKK